MRRALLWLVALAVLIAAGVAAYYALRDRGAPPPVVEPPPVPQVETIPVETPPQPVEPDVRHRGLVVLQIGDSHTAADIFTGRVRSLLQERYGAGGVLLPPGTPQAGVRSNVFAITASSGWSYERIGRSDHPARFWVSGYTAAAAAEGETITFTAPDPVTFTAIDVSLVAQPGGGALELLLDGTPIETLILDAPSEEPLIRRILPVGGSATFESLTLRSTSDRPVMVTGVTVLRDEPGISYLSVGYPGARADLLLDFDTQNLANDLTRIDPDVIVVAFGTNEGFDDNLSVNRYRSEYTEILDFFRTHAPNARLVVVQPPIGSREGPCTGGNCGPAGYACWNVPQKLLEVREVQAEVADEVGATRWDWAAALPAQCTGNAEATDLYAGDRIHLTNAGYRYSADRFTDFLATLLPAPAAP